MGVDQQARSPCAKGDVLVVFPERIDGNVFDVHRALREGRGSARTHCRADLDAVIDRLRIGRAAGSARRRGADACLRHPATGSSRAFLRTALRQRARVAERLLKGRAASDELEHLLLARGERLACFLPVMSWFMPTQAMFESAVGSTGTPRTETHRHSRLECSSRNSISNGVRVATARCQQQSHAFGIFGMHDFASSHRPGTARLVCPVKARSEGES